MRNALPFLGATLVLGAVAVGVLGALPAVAEPDVLWHPDLVYAEPDGTSVLLNLARPSSAGPHPTLVILHGGGWVAGHRMLHNGLARQLARRGYVAATVGYRLAPIHPWPAQIEDARAAVRWLRAHADAYGIDPQRIGALGFSAGAHLAMLLGTLDGDESASVSAVTSWFGPTDLAAEDFPEASRAVVSKLLGAAFADDPGAASPVRYVDPGDAPMLLFQGTRDPLVPTRQAVRMAEALTEAGVHGRVVLLLGEGHGWRDPLWTRTLDEALAFFALELGRP